jgi:opacity protein-like surface antigen/ketosteroid isomerase-like protein
MKKIVIVTAIMMLIAAVTAAQAEISASSFSVTPFIGGYLFEGNEYGLKSTYTAGLRAGYDFTKKLGMEGFFFYVPTEVKDAYDADVKLYGYGIEGLYHFTPKGRLMPFLAIGFGGIHYSIPTDPNGMNKYAVDYGGGLKYFIKDNVALRADVRHVIPLNDNYNDFLVTFGITFFFGEKRKEVVTASVEELVIPKETAVAAKIEEPVAPKEVAAVPKAEETAAPKEAVAAAATVAAPAVTDEKLVPVSRKQNELKSIPEEDIRNLVNKWLASWQSGDMNSYRNCYASDFQSKGKNLDAWISYKTNVHKKSKNINISIDALQVSADANNAKAIFTQHYSSSILTDSGKKTLEIRKINGEWKIYNEMM